jgi:hypothetical protein
VLGVGFLPLGITGLLLASAPDTWPRDGERMRWANPPDGWKVAERGIDTAAVAFKLNVAVMAYWALFAILFFRL